MAADMAVVAVAGTPVLAVGMAAALIGTAEAGIALLVGGMGVVVTGTVVTGTVVTGTVVTGTAVAGMAGVVAGITVVAVAVGELAPRSVSVLALDSSEEH